MIKVIRIPANSIEGHDYPKTTYLQVGSKRFVWHDGAYSGWYKFKED